MSSASATSTVDKCIIDHIGKMKRAFDIQDIDDSLVWEMNYTHIISISAMRIDW